jgi:hypothetical protein
VTNNRIQFVPREKLSGLIEGVDFGNGLSCIARSPGYVILWSSGTSYTSGRQTRYGASCMYEISRKGRMNGGASKNYRRLGGEGGRLTIARIETVRFELKLCFGDDVDQIAEAVRLRQTVLIEGGGPPLCPHHSVGAEALKAWRDLPEKGLYGDWGRR